MSSWVEAVRRRVERDFAGAGGAHELAHDVAHDVAHLDRVAGLAARIAREVGADPDEARVAAYVHDYHRLIEARQGRGRPVAPEEAAGAIRGVLAAAGVPQERWDSVLAAVAVTERYRCAGDQLEPVSPVSAAVHDADDLDALGAVGVARAFAFGGLLGEPLWDPREPVAGGYRPGVTSSVLAHVYEKLVHLEGEMLTAPGRRLAADRALVLHRFAADLRSEWEGGPAMLWEEAAGFLAARDLAGDEVAARVSFSCQAAVGVTGHSALAVRLEGLPDPVAPAGHLSLKLAEGTAERWVEGPADAELDLCAQVRTGAHGLAPAGWASRVDGVRLHLKGRAG